MKHRITQNDGALTVKLSDELTFDDHGIFRELLEQISSSGSTRCVLDLIDLNAIDSAGLGMLMIAFEASEKEHWEFVVSRPRGQVKRMLEITEFEKIMTIEG